MTDNEIINLFSDYVWQEEYGSVSFVDGFILVQYERGAGHLIKICAAEEFNERHAEIVSAAAAHPECNQLFVYFAGEKDNSIAIGLERWKMVAHPIYAAWRRYPQLLVSDDPIGDYVRNESVETLSRQLVELATGDGLAYQKVVAQILHLSLYPRVVSIQMEERSLNNHVRRDLTLRLNGGYFAKHLSRALLSSNNIIVECKNKKTIVGTDVNQIAGYLGIAQPASVGLLITREPLTTHMRSIAVEKRRDKDGKIAIIPLHDDILLQMLQNVRDVHFDANEGILIALFEKYLADVH